MRLFLAGLLPDELARDLVARLESVRAAAPQTRWVAREALHLTLLFCPQADPAAVGPLGTALDGLAGRHPPLPLTVEGPETFGSARAPRVLAARIGGAVAGLEALCRDARAVASPHVSMGAERPFRPHLTLARAREGSGEVLLGRCATALGTVLAGAFVLDAVTLFRSETHPDGAVHTPLRRWTLTG